jgi:hypothetical protein
VLTDLVLALLSWAVTPGERRRPSWRARSRRAEAAGVATAR